MPAKLALSILGLFISPLALALGGSEVGNPTDNPSLDQGSAWFLSQNRSIHYCYEIAPGFGVSATEAESAINASFSAWKNYLEERQVLDVMRDVGFGISFSFSAVAAKSCTGQEDLKFYFGVSTPETDADKSHLENPTAFAFRQNYNAKEGWGRGFVWFAPPESVNANFPKWNADLLKKVLLHEVGHIYGCAHVRGTIMDEFLSTELQREPVPRAEIDQRHQLVFCWNCRSTVYTGLVGYRDAKADDGEAKVFKRFVGHAPIGSVQGELHLSTNKFVLRITDSKGFKDIPLSMGLGRVHSGFDRGERIFKAVWAPDTSAPDISPANISVRPRVFDFFNGGRVEYGLIHDAKGHALNLIMEVNSHSLGSPGPFTLRWMEKGVAHSLFFALPN